MGNRRAFLAGAAALAGAQLLPSRGFAQTIDQLQLFVPAAPGGGWDQTARALELILKTEKLIGTAQITNVPGAGGTVGLPQFVNQWKNRPNALMVGGMVMVGAIIANKAPVDLTKTVPIARLTGESLVLAVPPNSPFKTAKDFANALKADPAKVPVCGGSAGGSDHILLGMIAKAAGAPPQKIAYVPYAGGGPALAALLGGHVAAGISGYGEFGEQIKAGKLKALAVTSRQRSAAVPDIPTIEEAAGLKGFDATSWFGLLAPAGTPPDIVNRIQQETAKALNSPAIKEKLLAQGAIPSGNTPAEFARHIDAEHKKWAQVVKVSGAKVD